MGVFTYIICYLFIVCEMSKLGKLMIFYLSKVNKILLFSVDLDTNYR
jgi:hypothetical protein